MEIHNIHECSILRAAEDFVKSMQTGAEIQPALGFLIFSVKFEGC